MQGTVPCKGEEGKERGGGNKSRMSLSPCQDRRFCSMSYPAHALGGGATRHSHCRQSTRGVTLQAENGSRTVLPRFEIDDEGTKWTRLRGCLSKRGYSALCTWYCHIGNEAKEDARRVWDWQTGANPRSSSLAQSLQGKLMPSQESISRLKYTYIWEGPSFFFLCPFPTLPFHSIPSINPLSPSASLSVYCFCPPNTLSTLPSFPPSLTHRL